MIILIAGASHTGKTCLAQRLLEKHGYPTRTLEEIRTFVGNGARRLIELAVAEGGHQAAPPFRADC